MKIKVREAGKVRIVDLRGELKLGNRLQEEVKDLLAGGHSRIVINLKHVPWIDTSGITALVASKKRALDKGSDVVLLSPAGKTARILMSSLIQMYIKVYDNEPEAVGSIRAAA